MSLKSFFRWIGIFIVSYLFLSSLIFFANTTVFNQIASNPEKVKAIVKDSGAYQNIPSLAYNQAVKEAQKNSKIDLNNPEIKAKTLSVFDADFFQANTEKVLDSTYDWLNGKTNAPEVKIDISEQKQEIANLAVSVAANRAKKLPYCTIIELQKFDQNTDIFNLECLPPGIDIDQEAAKARKELKNSQDFLPQTTFIATDFKDKGGNPVVSKENKIPEAFQRAKFVPFLALIISVSLGAGLVFLGRTRKQGLRILAVMMIFGGFVIFVAPKTLELIAAGIGSGNPTDLVKEVVQPIFEEFSKQAAKIYYVIGAIVLTSGLVLLAVEKGYLKKQVKKNESSAK